MLTTDVLIIGAGPVGMTLAMELSLHGVNFRIVEKEAARSDKSRSLAAHARTMELLDRYGEVDELLARAAPVAGQTVWLNRKKFDPIEVSRMRLHGTRFPGPVMVSQVETEAFLLRRLGERGVRIESPVAATSVRQDADGATVVLENEGVEETVRCKYVVGCDGAHSVVRHSTGMKFQGGKYMQEFILTDACLDWNETIDRVSYVLGDALMIIFPLHGGMARVMASRPYHNSEDDPAIEEFQELLTKMLPGSPRIHDPVWLSRFHLHHRCVDKYSEGRLFVCGDAAHIHSPVGGQGMNTGIQDAFNLGWKLARVLRGDSLPSFLDSYHQERWPVGQHLIFQTDQVFTFVSTADPSLKFLRNLALPFLLSWLRDNSQVSGQVFRYLSGLDIKYRESEIVGTASGYDGPVRGGFRAPDGVTRMGEGRQGWLQDLLKGPTYHLLLFAGTGTGTGTGTGNGALRELEAAEEEFLEAVQNGVPIHIIMTTTASQETNPKAVIDVGGELHRLYGFESKPGYVHVRPDGYVEHIGTLDQMGELVGWLKA